MLAARAHPGESRFRLERVPIPSIEAGEVLVKVHSAGITHGLLSLWRNGRTQLMPGVLGHEAAGEVAEVGAGASRWRVGDRVRLHPTLTCRDYAYCRSDRETLCNTLAVIGHRL
jgi:D-arabinose 1-dehydrogenase-like Zn-dependent alcohol dehydrogenase